MKTAVLEIDIRSPYDDFQNIISLRGHPNLFTIEI